jgi:hypothetical protein
MRKLHGELKLAYEVADFYDQRITISDLWYHVFIDHEGGHFHRMTDALVFLFRGYYLVFQEHSSPEVHHRSECIAVQYYFYGQFPTIIPMSVVDGERMPFERAATLDGVEFGVVKTARIPEEGERFYVFWPEGRKPEDWKGNTVGVYFDKMTYDLVQLRTPTSDEYLCEEVKDETVESPGSKTPDLPA